MTRTHIGLLAGAVFVAAIGVFSYAWMNRYFVVNPRQCDMWSCVVLDRWTGEIRNPRLEAQMRDRFREAARADSILREERAVLREQRKVFCQADDPTKCVEVNGLGEVRLLDVPPRQ